MQQPHSWIEQQVEQYARLPIWKTARGQMVGAVFLFLSLFIALALYRGIPTTTIGATGIIVVSFLTVILTWLSYHGYRWALIFLIIFLSLQILTMAYDTVFLVLSLIAIIGPLYRDFKVESQRRKIVSPPLPR